MLRNKLDDREQKTLPSTTPWIEWSSLGTRAVSWAGQDVVPKIKPYKDAIVALEDVVLFLQHKGNTEEAMSLGSTLDQQS